MGGGKKLRLGFSVYERTLTDDQGQPFPILRMKLNKTASKENAASVKECGEEISRQHGASCRSQDP